MILEFVDTAGAARIRKEWKALDAPCYLKKTSHPLKFSVCLRKGVDVREADLFLIEHCMAPESQEKMKRALGLV